MVFYHGTNVEFDEFDMSKSAGMAMFTSSEEVARKFAGRWPMYDKEGNLVTDENGDYRKDGYVMPVYLNVRNPKIIDMEGYDWFGNGVGDNAGKSINKGRKTNFSYLEAKKAKREGYDGLILKNVTDGGGKSDHVIVFNANQIKSVYNIGTYRKDSNNIYEHRVVSDSVINGVIDNFAKKHHLSVNIVRDYYEGMGGENLHQAQQAYYAIYRAYKENVKAQLGEDYKLSTFSHMFAEVKEEMYNIFGNVDVLRDKEVQQALSNCDIFETAKQSAHDKVQAEHDRLNSLREMSDEELDAAYLKTLDYTYPQEGRMQRQRDIINVMAERRGYIDTASEYQGSLAFNGAAPSDGGWYDTKEERVQAFKDENFEGNQTLGDFITDEVDIADLTFKLYDQRGWEVSDETRRDSITNLRDVVNGKKGTITMYRAVPDTVQEGAFRNGDWITPSRKYAELHAEINGWGQNYRIIEQEVSVEHIWWDGNDIAEWGFDDGQNYRYKNTLNNIKSNALVEYDDQGRVIMPSQRFDDRTADVRYMKVPKDVTIRPAFYSNAFHALMQISQKKATPEQWLSMLQKAGGIKAGEDRWTGLSEWLKASEEKILTKDKIAEYLRENMISVEEVHYIEARSLEDSEQFHVYQREFDDIKENVDDLYEAADNKYGEFIAEMTEKYGEDWMDQLNDDEDRQERYLLKVREDCDTSYHSPIEIAYNEMISRYGDDWGIAFAYYEEDGSLTIADEDCAVYFLGDEVSVDRAIHDVRLQNTTEKLKNKREIALTIPSIEPYKIGGRIGDIHFDDADDGRAIAWVRFGDSVVMRPLDDAEVALELQNLPSADQWEKVDGSNYVAKRDVYFAPGTRNEVAHDYIVDRDGQFVIELSTSRQNVIYPFIKDGYDSLEAAVSEYNRWQVSRMKKEEKVLVIDEIQSKRHQDGRVKGYKNISLKGLSVDSYDDERGIWHIKDVDGNIVRYLFDITTLDAHSESEALYIAAERRYRMQNDMGSITISAIPAAPFEKNWQELCMKRMLRYAAENGYDHVAWINGQQQVERYDLSKKINFVSYNKDTKRLLAGTLVDGVIDYEKYNIDETVEPDELSKFVGKDLAPKVLEKGILQGDDLRVGGDGMKVFYDEILSGFMNKYGKQWGVHVEDMDIPAIKRDESSDGVALHSVRVTEQMQRDVLEGQPMFFRKSDGEAYGFVKDGEIYIDPAIATAETPIHEYTHLWAEVLRQQNNKEWQNIVRIMKDTPEVWNYVRQNYSALKTDDAIAEEALAQYSGKRGYQKLTAYVDGKKNADSILQKMNDALSRFWSKVCDFLHIHYTSKEQVADRILYDLINGVNPQDIVRMDEDVDRTETRAFKDWFGDWQDAVNPYSSRVTIGSPVADYDTVDAGGAGCMYPILLDGERIGFIPTAEYFDFKKNDLDMSSIIDGFVNINSFGNNVEIEPEYRGNGYGKAAYFELARLMDAKGLTLRSAIDSSRSDSANHVWEALERDGLAHKEGDRYVFDKGIFRNASKVIDEEGRPLVVEHATNADFTVFDPRHIGENSKDYGLFGAGFYFGTHAPGWMQGSKNLMKVYLNIRNPFELDDHVHDMFSEIRDKMDTPAMRDLTVKGFNDHEEFVGTLVDQIKAVDKMIASGEHLEQMAKDEELEYIRPDERLKVWREHEIMRRSGLGSLALSWQSLISDQIGSVMFTVAAVKDGYDGVIVDRGEDYKEYVAFDPSQIKSATHNLGTYLSTEKDIRYHFIGEKGATNLDVALDGGMNMAFLKQAKILEGLGKDAEFIKLNTGWEKGADGKWRMEIPGFRKFDPYANVEWLQDHPEIQRYLDLNRKDIAEAMELGEPMLADERQELNALRERNDVKYLDMQTVHRNESRLRVSDYVDAPMLFMAYPELREMPVRLADIDARGSFCKNEDILTGESDPYIKVNERLAKLARGLRVLDCFTHTGSFALNAAAGGAAHVTAVDISEDALATARTQFPGVPAPRFALSDVLGEIPPEVSGPFDVVVSNPPYVMESEKALMRRNVLDYEPGMALFVPDSDPLRFYRAVAGWASLLLRPGGLVAVEINESIPEETAAVFAASGFEKVETVEDFRGKKRYIFANHPL